ncbi:RTP2 [Cervus elaphus hippelaphus]|uniref:RTP2 n=2 Tax=Laurasiatheria TaxID=314145 RepID=A0A212CJG2_CEREH|nr:RTP2 [Cervus elaphus hippelaphus]
MCTSLTTCEWKKVFYEKMEVAKPADSWELIIDPNLKPNELAPGWKQYLEQHASGRFHCTWCWHTWQSANVVILFHMYLDRAQRAGSVRMRVFKQLMLEENIESLVDNLITSLREQCYGEDGGQYRIHVASRPDSGPHRGEFCEACQEGIVHWKPSEKLLEEEATFSVSEGSKRRNEQIILDKVAFYQWRQQRAGELSLTTASQARAEAIRLHGLEEQELAKYFLAELLSEPNQTENDALEPEDLSQAAEQDEMRLELQRSANSNPAMAPRERKAGCKNFFWKTFTSC